MASLNRVELIGRLGKDPVVQYTPSGAPVAKFSIATDESWTKDGERHTKTEWHNIVAWNKLAEICGEYLTKGKQVFIEGKLQTREWTDQSQVKRRTTEIVAFRMLMLGGKPSGEQAPRQPDRPAATAAAPAPRQEYESEIADEDIPF